MYHLCLKRLKYTGVTKLSIIECIFTGSFSIPSSVIELYVRRSLSFDDDMIPNGVKHLTVIECPKFRGLKLPPNLKELYVIRSRNFIGINRIKKMRKDIIVKPADVNLYF